MYIDIFYLNYVYKGPVRFCCFDGETSFVKYQPSGAGGTRSPPATPHRLQNPKWPPGGPKMADGVWKGV